jgi:hypothetical protein
MMRRVWIVGDEKDQTIFQVIGFVGKENKIAESHPREKSQMGQHDTGFLIGAGFQQDHGAGRLAIMFVLLMKGSPETAVRDWSRFDTMTPEQSHIAALDDPDAQPLTEEDFARMKRTPQIKVIRRALGLSR